LTRLTRWPLDSGFSPTVIAPVLSDFLFLALRARRARKAKNNKKKYRSAEGYNGTRYATA
jgi:hypothetical protein